jgi:hypothetical protein
MNKEKTLKIIILPVLVVLGVLVWGRAFRILGSVSRVNPPEDIAAVSSGAAGSDSFLPARGAQAGDPSISLSPRGKSAFEDWGRNPFVISSSGGPLRFILKGILWDAARPSAIINGEIVEKGGRIGPCMVLDIKPDKVLLNDGTRDLELRLDAGE